MHKKIMRNQILILLTAAMMQFSCSVSSADKDFTQYVNPFIGTGENHGHTYPGAVVPFGMVQLSPDTRTVGWDASPGYHYSDSSILGFSHTHLSGTGIGDYGDILFMPVTGNPGIVKGDEKNPDSGYRSRFSKGSEAASPGYYKVLLDDYNINVELTATTRTGFHRYTYPANAQKGLIIDLEHSIHNHRNLEAEIRVINEYEIEGLKRTIGWAQDKRVYFRAVFSEKFQIELYVNNEKVPGATEVTGKNVKAKLSFADAGSDVVTAKVAISAVDYEGANNNLKAEAVNQSFDDVMEEANKAWNRQLSKISVESDSPSDLTVFYTALYRASLAPHIYNDADGRYRGQDLENHHSNKPYYTVFSLWDTYRAVHPLFTIIDPGFNQDLIGVLLQKFREGGILPMWDLASNYTGTMIGSHAVSVIADAYMKGDRNFDAEMALKAMIHAVTYDTITPIPYKKTASHANLMPMAKLYLDKYGYVPADLEHSSVSQGLEFAYNFWCIARMAEEMGKEDIATEYYQKSQSYHHYFDPRTGFMRGKNLDGSWVEPFDPRYSAHWASPYVEGNAWQWNWYVPHDIQGMIKLHGNIDRFGDKMDSLFNVSSELVGEEASSDITGLIGQYAHGNEPSHHVIYLFNYAERPWRTQELVDRTREEFYTDQPNGLPGNEDVGQMSAWYIFNAMGFYPVCPGDNRYSIGKPNFRKLEIPLGNKKTFTVIANNLSKENQYVQAVYLDGEKLTRSYIMHDDITAGKTLTFDMGPGKVIFWK
jgi:predicted alpha-1,2-mannosidase